MSTSSALRAPSIPATACVLVAVKLGLAVLGFGRTLSVSKWLLRRRGAECASPTVLGAAARRVALVAAFFPGRALCLQQSLALWVLLRRRGVDADLRLGVQPYPWAAHAWVEHRGEPINESPELVRSFVTLPSFAR